MERLSSFQLPPYRRSESPPPPPPPSSRRLGLGAESDSDRLVGCRRYYCVCPTAGDGRRGACGMECGGSGRTMEVCMRILFSQTVVADAAVVVIVCGDCQAVYWTRRPTNSNWKETDRVTDHCTNPRRQVIDVLPAVMRVLCVRRLWKAA
jgi:hypothetical protein